MKKIAVMLLVLAGVVMTASANPGPPPPSVPEIDPGSIMSGAALVFAAVMMARNRRKV